MRTAIEALDPRMSVTVTDQFTHAVYRNPAQGLTLHATLHPGGQVTITRNGKPLPASYRTSHGVKVIRQAAEILRKGFC